ncbi:hypothetical protein CspeluHIS016_0105960 [Cutaneotrichosporon spelunceum]|uniref:Uncharacterized protein n=1 Tax=Cutaneotrichosporon spelunceum TaxID=1672016 RepID=A0AAD3TPG7_9TREE|nr:hypothetical protein CspeluHIS016_0105960 [Cutaneotrichosporon spelunceum]
MPPPPLATDAKRLRTMVIAFPVLVVTSAILYRRVFMGEKQRLLPRSEDLLAQQQQSQDSTLHSGTTITGAPWIRHSEEQRR